MILQIVHIPEKSSKIRMRKQQHSLNQTYVSQAEPTTPKGGFRWGIRKKIPTERVVRHWKRLVQVGSPALEVFQKPLDVVLWGMV